MATTSQVIDVMASRLGVSNRDLAMRARYLTPAGWLPKGGRGNNAPQLESRHAAALLVSALIPCSQIESPTALHALAGQGTAKIVILPTGQLVEALPNQPAPENGVDFTSGNFIEVLGQVLDYLRQPDPESQRKGNAVRYAGVIVSCERARGYLNDWRHRIIDESSNDPMKQFMNNDIEFNGHVMSPANPLALARDTAIHNRHLKAVADCLGPISTPPAL
ncbi:MAG: hypothetical protein WCF85_11610 [Rhodospirillaceae bacterium]